MDRIYTLERENELMRAELSHFRQHLSNNHQQREDERVRRGYFAWDSERVASSGPFVRPFELHMRGGTDNRTHVTCCVSCDSLSMDSPL